MSKIMLVAAREYRVHLRRGSFLFAAFVAPLLTIGIMLVVTTLVGESFRNSAELKRVGVVDEASIILIAKTDQFTPYTDMPAALAALNAGEIDGILRLPPDYLDQGGAELTTDASFEGEVSREFSAYLRSQLLPETTTLTSMERQRAIQIGDITIFTIDNEREQNPGDMPSAIILTISFAMIWMLTVQVTSSYLMLSIVEEKSNRIMEILLTSLTAGELLRGKMLGLVALGFTQLLVWVLAIAFSSTVGNSVLSFLEGWQVPLDMLIIASMFFILMFALISIVSATIGAVIGTVHESRQYAGIFSLVVWLPLFFLRQFLENPNSPIMEVLTLFPLTAPMTVNIRLGLGSIPSWQIVVSLSLLTLITLGAFWGGGRLFRWSLLRYGKRSNLRELLRLWQVQRMRQQA